MTSPATAVDTGNAGRIYLNPLLGDQSPEYMSVTTAIKYGVPKPLENWFKKVTAEFAVDNQPVWTQLDRDAAVDVIKREADRVRDAAADRGNIVHAILEAATTGTRPDRTWSPEITAYVDAGLAFLNDWQPTICWAETTVYSDRHLYAGSLDLLAHLAGLGLTLIDWKTAADIYPETGLQLAGYRFADYAIIDGAQVPVPPIASGAAVHLRPDGTYALIPVACGPKEHDTFLHAMHVARFTTKGAKKIKGPPLVAPTPGVMVVERKAWLRARVEGLRDAHPDALNALALMWPEGVPTLKADNGAHTLADLDAITRVIVDVEAAHDIPFPPPDPTATPVPTELREAIRARMERLPSDLVAEVSEAAKNAGVPHLSNPLVSRAHVDRLEPLLVDAEAEAIRRSEHRRALAVELLDGDAELHKLVIATIGNLDLPPTACEIEQYEALARAVNAGTLALVVTEDGTQSLRAFAGEETLVAFYGSKSAALAAARELASTYSRPTPRSAVAAAGDSVLVALATRIGPNTSDTDGVNHTQETSTP
jgi:hypothetical protein